MDVYEAIEKRVSIRKFRSEPISDDLLKKVLYAGTLAPNAFNTEPWEFIIIREKEIKDEIAKMREKIPRQKEAIITAPLLIAVCYDNKLGNESLASAYTCIENILLAATSEGLGAVILTFKGKKIRDLLSIPDNIEIACVMPLGYPAESPEKRPRIPLKDKIHLNKFL